LAEVKIRKVKNMKKCKTINMGRVLIAAALFVPLAGAQQEKIADQDLLNMMAAADAKSTAKPIKRVQEVVAVADERVVETEAVVEEIAPAVEEVVPVVEEIAPAVEEVVPVVEEIAPAVEEVVPVVEEIAPAVEEVVPVVEEIAPAVEEVVPVVEIADPVVDDLGMDSIEGATASISGNLVSVRLNRVGLEEAINLFAQLSGANIIVPQLTEAAQISVNLKDVEWRPALQSILDTYNYELYQRVSGSSVFSVRRRPPGAPEPQVVETFLLKYATVPNAANLIRELLPDDAKIAEFASRNMLVVKTTESALGEVRAVLSSIDVVRQQVYIESKFMELTAGNQLDVGIDWQQLGLDENNDGGLGASFGASSQTYTDGRQRTALGPTDAGATLPVGDFTDHIFTSVLDLQQFNVVLNALESDRGVNVVSNPKIIVANEEKANISIVRKHPNLKQSQQASMNNNADTITFELDEDRPFFDFGIKLDVTPSINTSSNITVKINPSLTRFYDNKSAGDYLSYPIYDEKSIETVFSLADGQTAAIGGLTELSDSETERKVPLLGRIPFLGRLFSWSQAVNGQNETIIFVTVGLANTQAIDLETSLPKDSELARRQLIKESRKLKLRKQGRKYYEVREDDKVEDSLESMKREEANRLALRQE